MKIALRHTPFSTNQKETITQLISSAGHEAKWFTNDPPCISDLQDCEVLMGFYPPEVFSQLPGLKWLQTTFAGVDKFCGDIYANKEVTLTNCSGAFGITISEYIFTGLLMLMRRMPSYMENQKQQLWHCEGDGKTIYGSTITIVGMGNLGSNVAKRAKAFGAHVRGVRRTNVKSAEYFDEVYTTDQLNEAVSGVDAVILCLPGTKETTHLISEECISHMSSNTIVVNCGRGFTVDQEALTKALLDNRLAGAVLDVAETEPLPKDHPLWSIKNVIITPHISGRDNDPVNTDLIYDIFMTNLKHYFVGEPLEHVVDRAIGY